MGSSLATYFCFHYFKSVPAGFFANIILVPAASFLQIPALALSSAGMFLGVTFLSQWGAACAGFIEALCDCFGEFLPLPIPTSHWNWFGVASWCFALYLLPLCLRKWPKSWLGMLIAAVILSTLPSSKPAFQIDVLPVGHGDASFVYLDNGGTMLIDGGGQFHQGEMQPPRVLLEYVRRKKIKSIDVMVVSHPDPDHIIGLIEILNILRSKRFGTVVSLSGTHSCDDSLKKRNANIPEFTPGQTCHQIIILATPW